ncbi:MAG: DNA repair protein RadC [Planctomycetota bacterium]
MERSIQERPFAERPREKLFLFGEDDLTDAECLALVVGNVASKPAISVAVDLLTKFESLRNLQKADPWELIKIGRLGSAGAASLKAAFIIGKRSARPLVDPLQRIKTGADLYERFHARCQGLRKEFFFAIYVDSRNCILREERVSEGTLNAAIVHPRDVFGQALRIGAAGVLVIHNHPTGDPSPSAEDLAVTTRLRETGKLIGIPLIDHVIIGDERYFSFLERGYFQNENSQNG